MKFAPVGHQKHNREVYRSIVFVLSTSPFGSVRCRNLVGLPKGKKDGDFVIVGDPLLETDFHRFKTRSPFEHNVVFQFDLMVSFHILLLNHSRNEPRVQQEHLFDHIFTVCGVDGDRLANPLLLTETVCNPNYSRARTQLNALVVTGACFYFLLRDIRARL